MSLSFAAPDGRRLAFHDDGAGPVVLCLAGLTRDSRDFAALTRHLAPRHRVLRLDARGRGESEWAQDPVAEYQLPVESGDAVALLDHLGIARATIIGTSRGGLIGMGLGAAMPDRVAALVLNDIGPVVEPGGIEAIMGYLGIEPGWASFEEAATEMARTLGPAFPDLDAARWLDFARALYRDEGGRPRLSYDPRLRDAVAASMEAAPADLWAVFDALAELPLLTIRGGRSNILSAETLAEMARRRPDMAHVTLDNRGHVPFLDEPPALAAIDLFLAEHAR